MARDDWKDREADSNELSTYPAVLPIRYNATSDVCNGKDVQIADSRLSLCTQTTSDDNGRRASLVSVTSRGTWGSKWEFLLSCVGLSVGIGNVWRFPYLAYQNGGGAFLIPYLIMLLLAGKPIYFMELAFGQFAGVGPLAVWACCPIAKGVGYAMVTLCFIVCIYYNVVMAYTIFYTAASFQSEVPWSRCDEAWANGTTCYIRHAESNITGNGFKSAPQVYWERYVLDLSDGIENVGTVKWDLALCLLLSWILVVVCLVKGIKTSGKVVYFAATFPYVILLTLLITGLVQEGAVDGVLYFITPTWDKLLDIQVWQAAAGQMFYSLGVSMGALIMYSSYNNFSNNIFRDAMVVSVLDTLTSIISGLAIFSVLGAMAHDLGGNTKVEDVVAGGPGLAFVAYPEALSRLPVPQLWAVLFFVMLFILGLDSEFAMLESILTSIADELPILRKHRLKFCIVTATVCYLLGLACVTQGGQYIFDLMDKYGGGTSVVFVAIMECIAVSWLYGTNQFSDDVYFMLGKRVGWYWRWTWRYTAPLVLSFVFIYSLVMYQPSKYESYRYPFWADCVGWGLALISMIQIPLWAIIAVIRQEGPDLKTKFLRALQPSENWGPSDSVARANWKQQKLRGAENAEKGAADGSVDNPAFSNYEGSSKSFHINLGLNVLET